MPFPNVEGKHAHEAMFGPHDFIAYLKKQGLWEDFPAPDGVVFFYQPWFLDKVVAREAAAGRLQPQRTPAALLSFYLVGHNTTTLGLSGGFGIGSPAAAAVMEELIAAGVNQFIGIGTAGGLQKDLGIGSIVVCDRAVRDEGVSHHYVEPAKYAHTSTGLTLRLKEGLAAQGLDPRIGTSWTIDAPYRETVEELKQYQAEGVLTVDMEAAAMASVATHRRVKFAAAFVISDTLVDLVWDPQFRSTVVADSLDRLYSGAVTALMPQGGNE
jgi:uridine phosphorylase